MAAEAYSRHLIRMARRQAGFTQAELAARAATSQAAISAYESGRRSPSVETLTRVLEAAGCELRMRLVQPDNHDRTRRIAEALLPPAELKEFTDREHRRASRARRRVSADRA
ncbi:MAG: helix-turn-helix transcriptional regulator [Actinobacteria bacterium]|nr:helix-turn-helix transcriptional regulator [Actinomycetota bacterium]